ncbi:uncharacterized protein KGF55_001524 [Candida pseudojiufengensis]|uniref:uncharacterized protein n=1 Tax=Candida pseudojiufengensis TaxID=497109 RepID=UPI002225A3BD|nr:uncharacterized protein KGF55_001524 [Candida pseudojiufengensis]KAI5965304.1 hypothetical protein KGF55_001524 [Candida pseudojiufengensis]
MSTDLPPAIVFTDWDGTVTLQDSNDYLTDNLGMGQPARLKINDLIFDNKLSFRDGFKEMLESIPTPFNECIEYLLKNVKLDPGFKEFYKFCHERNIPIVVVSSGMTPIITALLTNLVGQEAVSKIEILSNDVRIDDNGKNWEIVFKDPDSHFGHDKSKSILNYLKQHGYSNGTSDDDQGIKMFYIGDGVSDKSGAELLAKLSDSSDPTKDLQSLLFAKHGKDLIKICIRDNIPFTEFNDFGDVLNKMKKIIDDNDSINSFVENSKIAKESEELKNVKESTK